MNFIQGISDLSFETRRVQKTISKDRTRTNLLRKYEERALAYLVQRIPYWISSNMLSFLGLFGSFIVFVSFILADNLSRFYLLLGLPGFAINWFGDSLDGRIAYYRNMPRKLYGFILDITIDWIGIALIGCGYVIYAKGIWELMGYVFIAMYGWEMMLAMMRYKLTGKYSIDAGRIGPTEVRLIISTILVAEVLLPGSAIYTTLILGVAILYVNILDTYKLLNLADEMDIKEMKKGIS